jgi:hypothetical protein
MLRSPFANSSMTMAKRLPGYRPTVMIREGLQKTLDWFIRAGKV